MKKHIATTFNEFLNEKNNTKTEIKSIKKVDDFFNKLAKDIDKKYFPDVKYYRDDENDTAVHRAIELFNNGASTYTNLIKKLAKSCKESEKNIHTIVKKYIKDFGDFKYESK